jgi:hypothetical protein
MKEITRKVVGVILILVGFFSLVTPATPGAWLILVGLELLGLRLLLHDKLIAWAKAHPGTRLERAIRAVLRAEDRVLRRWKQRKAKNKT